MIERKTLLEALEDSRASLNKILLAVHMAGNETRRSYETSRELDVIRKLEKAISDFADNRLYDWIKDRLANINRQAKTDLLTIDNKKILLCDTEILFYIPDNDYKEAYEKYEAAEPMLIKRVVDAIHIIETNHTMIKSVCTEVIKELRNQPFITNKQSLHCSFNKRTIGRLDMEFSYMHREKVNANVNIFELVDKDKFTSNIKKEVISKMKEKIVRDRTLNINRAIEDICTENKIGNVSFKNFSKNAEKPWDFEQGYISFDLDLSVCKVSENFTRELVGCVRAVEALYFSKFDHITINKDIRLGNCYYYRKKETREHEGEQYDIYEGRVGTRKELLFIVKDGKRIFGRQRSKLLRAMNLNKLN